MLFYKIYPLLILVIFISCTNPFSVRDAEPPDILNDSYTYESYGRDIFELAGSDLVFEQERRVRRAGDHLVEVYCDAIAEYYARVEVQTPLN